MVNKIVQYYVEGENERSLINQLKGKYLSAGKVEVLNVLQKNIRNSHLRVLKPKTTAVLVFDIDIENNQLLDKLVGNIKILKESRHVNNVIIIPQIRNFEEEIVRATNIAKIEEFIPTDTVREFKTNFNKLGDGILKRLEKYQFDILLFWEGNIPSDSIFAKLDRSHICPEKIKKRN